MLREIVGINKVESHRKIWWLLADVNERICAMEGLIL